MRSGLPLLSCAAMNETELRFREAFCNGAELPALISQCVAGGTGFEPVFEDAAVSWLDPSEPPDLLSQDYLNDEDRKNPDTMSNVEATNVVFGRIAWLFSNDEGALFGYWLGDDRALSFPAEAVTYDTEGTFEAWGKIPLGDLVAYAGAFGDDETYARLAAAAKEAGLPVVHGTLPALFKTADACTFDIEALHDNEYNRARAARGLEPV